MLLMTCCPSIDNMSAVITRCTSSHQITHTTQRCRHPMLINWQCWYGSGIFDVLRCSLISLLCTCWEQLPFGQAIAAFIFTNIPMTHDFCGLSCVQRSVFSEITGSRDVIILIRGKLKMSVIEHVEMVILAYQSVRYKMLTFIIPGWRAVTFTSWAYRFGTFLEPFFLENPSQMLKIIPQSA